MKTKFTNFPDNPEIKGQAREYAIRLFEHTKNKSQDYDLLKYVVDPVEGYLSLPTREAEFRFYHSQGAQLAYRVEFIHDEGDRKVVMNVTKDEYVQRLWDELYSSGEVHSKRKLVFKN